MRSNRWAAVVACGLAVALCPPLLAGDVPVNTQLDGPQTHPDVAVDPGGALMVVWHSEGPSGGPELVEGRLFAAGGAPVGPQFQLNDSLRGELPAVAALGSGRFVAVWQAGARLIRARRYDAAGAPLGGFFDASEDGWPPLGSACVDVAAGADGRFAIAWIDFDGFARIQRYAADGTAVGPRISASPGFEEAQQCPAIAFDQQGSFAIAYLAGPATGGPDYAVWLQRYAADGAPLGGRVRVDDATLAVSASPSLVVDPDGDLLVAWTANFASFQDKPLAQRFSAAGSALGGNFELAPLGFDIAASGDAEGNVVVVIKTFSGPELGGIIARRIGADGTFLGPLVQVAGAPLAQHLGPAVAADPAGNFVAAWSEVAAGGQDPTDADIIRSEAVNITKVFADGFESGDTARWSEAVR